MECARHWLDCPSSLTHGNMIKRVILTREDPENPGKEGAVMRKIESFARAVYRVEEDGSYTRVLETLPGVHTKN